MSIQQALDLDEAVERTAGFFADRETRAGLQARALLRRVRRTDQTLAEHLIRERRRTTRMDGSVNGSLIQTAWTTWELVELGCPRDHAAVVRTLGYVLSTQDGGGHFAEGCTKQRHELKICCHHLSGFFSPATRDETAASITFPSGVVITGEESARFAASCFALRIVLLAGEERRPKVRKHLDSLVLLSDALENTDGNWSPDLVCFALGAFAAAPFEYRPNMQRLTDRVTDCQDAEGHWIGVDMFHALDVLLAVPTTAAQTVVLQTAPSLCTLQRESGAFDDAEDEQKALIGLRALYRASQSASQSARP